ncbi:MAG: HD domain-containing protein [Desulfovibrio sp.]|nr:HD domain-containing protein [Desulfovibrio sp.]
MQTSVVDGVFAVASAERQNTRTGKAFWKLRLVDSTGSIEGKIWCDNTGVLHPDRLATGDLILIQRGRISEWKGTPQISTNTALAVRPEDLSGSERTDWFVPPSAYDGAKAFDELMALAAEEFSSPAWRSVVDGFFGDPAQAEAFKTASAAASMHHVGAGGLCAHTLEVFKICQAMANLYPSMDRQTLLAGALFHDIGKLEEMRSAIFATEYTLNGNLVGHMVLGVQMLKPFVDKSKLPEHVAAHFYHLILSHHGQPEFGAVKAPASMEAFTLHHADMLSSHLNAKQRLLGEMQENEYRRQWGEDPVFKPEKTPASGELRQSGAIFASRPDARPASPPPPSAGACLSPEPAANDDYVLFESEPAGTGIANEVPQWLEDAPVPVDAPDAEWQRLPDGLGEAPEGAGDLPAEAMAALAEAGLAVGAGVEAADLSQAFGGSAPPASLSGPSSDPASAPADLRAVFGAGDDAGASDNVAAADQPLDQPTVQGSEALADLQAAFGVAGIDPDAPSPTLVERSDASGNQGSEDALADLESAFGDAGTGPEAQPVFVETGASPGDHGSEDALAELEPAVGDLAVERARDPAEGKAGLQADAEPNKAPEAAGRPASAPVGEEQATPASAPAEAAGPATMAKAPEAPESSQAVQATQASQPAPASAPSAAAGAASSGKRGRPAQDKDGAARTGAVADRQAPS